MGVSEASKTDRVSPMVTTTSSMANRSSLELMLDKLQQKQTQIEEKPQHAPPPLPIRPLSRARARPPRRPEFGRRENGERAGFAESGGGAAAAPALHFLVKVRLNELLDAYAS